jgi:type VI secretion system protein ImpH
MAGTTGNTPDTLIQRLEEQPYGFDFFRAVRLLECQDKARPRVGYSQSPAGDALRFGQNPSLSFAPSTIEAFKREGPGAVPRMFVHFFGLFGPHGPLPPHLTEYAHERALNFGDRSIVAFANLFHHRLISFFYRAWADNQKAVDLDRPDDQRFAAFIGSFLGIGMESLQGQDPVQDWAKLYFAGRLACQTRNAEGLEAVLKLYFAVPGEVQTFVGRWLRLPPDCVCQLGGAEESSSLGLSTILGSRFWECQLSFRIKLGPMKLHDYERFLPGGGSFERLKCWVLNYCGEQFFWDVQMVLMASEVPDIRLGKAGRLGWTTWMKTGPLPKDADDLILSPPPE